MPPKSDLLTTGYQANDYKTKAFERKPLTTQGKMLKARKMADKQLQNVPREVPEPLTKKPKAHSFAPPDEIAEEERLRRLRESATARKLTTKNGKWDFTRNTPITTQEKCERAKAIQRSKGGVQATMKASTDSSNGIERIFPLATVGNTFDAMDEGEAAKPKKSVRTGQPKVPGTYIMLQYHDPYAWSLARPVDKPSVLIRPTERAKQHRRGAGSTFQASRENTGKGTGKARGFGFQNKRAGKNILHLPKDIRVKIWKSVVVERKYFIWPNTPTGREQPDLAMTCKQIRAEVLPIYYSENTFAISIAAEVMPACNHPVKKVKVGSEFTKKKPLTGLAAAHKWASVLEEKQARWFGMIKNWVFDHEDRNCALFGRKRKADEEDQSFLVSIQFKKTSVVEDELRAPSKDNHGEARAAISHCIESPSMQIHREGSCIIGSWKNCGLCVVQSTPEEAAQLFIRLLDASGPKADSIISLAKAFRELSAKLVEARCLK